LLFLLDLRDKNVGGAVLPARLVYPAGSDVNATLDLLAIQTHVVFVLHGFNVDRVGGQKQLKAFADRLNIPGNPAFVALTWPGDSFAGPASYPLEGNDADDSAHELAKFIEWAIPPGTKFSFTSHSLGARVVMETIKRLPRDYPIDQVCVMAAAIDDFGVSEPKTYRAEVERATRVAVLASERDNVLRWAYPLGDFLQSFLFFWKDVSGSALGYHGPRPTQDKHSVPENIEHVQIPTSAGVDHADYLFPEEPSPLEERAVAFANAAMRGEKPLAY
jgi:hypothetical protein